MSNTEFHYGKLIPIDLEGKTKEEFFENKSREEGLEKYREKEDNWENVYKYYSGRNDRFFTNGSKVWEIIDHVESDDYEGYFKIFDNKDGTYSFITSFYNGGTCLGEILDEEIKKLN